MSASDRSADQAWRAERQAHWRQYAMWLLIGLSGWLCLALTGAHPTKLFDQDGLRNAGDILTGMAHPDVSRDFLARVFELSVESLLIGILGTVMAVLLGTSLAFFAIRVPDLPDPPRRAPAWVRHSLALARWLTRLVLSVLRAIPEIVWAYLFVRLIGLGPGAAVLAIGLTVGGNIGKLYAELAEAVEPRTVQALRAAGASRWAIFLHAVLPQVSRQWTGYALFCLECNIRIGTILGVVGAGGLGSEIGLSLRYFQYDKLATTLLAVLAFVVALELVSAQLRQRRARWSLGLAAMGSAWALHQLDIPWADLLSSQAPPLLTFDKLVLDAPFVQAVAAQIGETLMMAWVATLVSAGLAFVLAPLAASHLMTGSYLSDPPRTAALSRLWRQALKWASRAILQGTRVVPELTLALVFVVWVGGGPLAGIMAIAVHNIGVMGRLFADVFEEVEAGPPAVLQAQGAGTLATFLFGVLPQVKARLAAFTLYRFEVNVRATAMVGFVGAGGIGNALNTAISLFHMRDLTLLLLTMLTLVAVVDALGDKVRARILSAPFSKPLLAPYA
ncbi:MAG: ABC transporter permease subunit [Aquabacterium sp.]|uniref:ABC transporter permease subunit n=1 Tax=Aquabacterium sp. TaxID=1872578 RepID=UPI0025C3FE5F|nr:ABC transporter permease subunit [Aquabacterium sp.]MBI3382061.1 ABC transporter permease subunit [Aquabacterium sp.]